MYSKRGVSGVIAVVLLILLTIVSVTIIAGVLIPFARENLKESTRCSDVIEGLTIVSSKTCYDIISNPDNNVTNITIRRGNIDIDGIFLAGNDVDGAPITSSESEYFDPDLPDKGGGEFTYELNGHFTDLGVGPIVNGKRCPLLDEIEVKKCR